MRDLKFREIFRFAIVLMALFIFSSTCKNDDEVSPDYVGKWITAKTVPVSTGFTKVNYTLTLTDNSFTETFLEDVRSSTFPNTPPFVTIEGFITISGNNMNFLPKKISFSNYNSATATVPEPYLSYTDKDQDFNAIFEGLDFTTCSHQVEFGLVDNQLIQKMDINEDGSFAENEKFVYTKQ